MEVVSIRFIKIDLPESSRDDRCDVAYFSFGGYSNKGEKIIHERLCGKVRPDSYQTKSSSAWMTFVWTGRVGVMPTRPIIVETEFTLRASENLFNQMISGIFCFLSMFVMCCLPLVYYVRTSKQRMEYEIWGPLEEIKKIQLEKHYENLLTATEYNAAHRKRCKKSPSGKVRKSFHQRILSHTLSRSRRSYHRVKQQIAIADMGCESSPRVSERCGETATTCEAVVHHPKLPCFGVSNFHTKQNAAILQSILKTFPVQHSNDASKNTAEGPYKENAAGISMSLLGMATSRTAEDESLTQIPMESVTPPSSSHRPQGLQRPLASICNEESFRAVASSSEILCSTPYLRGEVLNNNSSDASVTLSLEIGSYQPRSFGMSVNRGEKDGDKITRNAQQLHTTNDEEAGKSQRCLLNDQMGAFDMLRSLPTEEISSNSINHEFNLMPLNHDRKSLEDSQSCSIYLSNRESDFTFVSGLTKSSDFEPEDNMKFDSALMYFQNHKHTSDQMSSESLQHIYERQKYLNDENASFEPNDQSERTSKDEDSSNPVIVIDMQPLTAVSSSDSSSLTCSSKTSSEVGRRHHQFNKSHLCTHLLNYTTSLSNDPGINSESQADAGSNRLQSKYSLHKTCNSRGNVDQNVSEALPCHVSSQHVYISDTTMPVLLTTREENVDRAAFNSMFHHPGADTLIEGYNPFSIIKYDQMGNPYHETMC